MSGITTKRIKKQQQRINNRLNLASACKVNQRCLNKSATFNKDFFIADRKGKDAIDPQLLIVFQSRFANVSEEDIGYFMHGKSHSIFYLWHKDSDKSKNTRFVIAAVIIKESRDHAEVVLLATNVTFEKLGFATLLLEKTLPLKKRIYLISDKLAIRFYERCGFVPATDTDFPQVQKREDLMVLNIGQFRPRDLKINSAEFKNKVFFNSTNAEDKIKNQCLVSLGRSLVSQGAFLNEETEESKQEILKEIDSFFDCVHYRSSKFVKTYIEEVFSINNSVKRRINQIIQMKL